MGQNRPSVLFISLPVPEEVTKAVYEVRRYAQENWELPGVNWMNPVTWHVTLCHVGSVYDLDRIVRAVEQRRLVRPSLILQPLLSQFEATRALHMPVDGGNVLAEQVTEAVESIYGEDRADHVAYPFRGHLTLGVGDFPSSLLRMVPQVVAEAIRWRPREIHFVISHRKPQYRQEHVRTIRL